MNDLEGWLRKYAIYSSKDTHKAPIHVLFQKYPPTLLSERGMLSYVYKCENIPWVVKEAKWELDLHFADRIKLSIPKNIGEKLLVDRLLPRPEEIFRQYSQYQKVLLYLGVSTEGNYFHPDLADIAHTQLQIREHLVDYLDVVTKEFTTRHTDVLAKILLSDLKYKNFLPKEYMIIGKGYHAKNLGRDTSYIFQEYIAGAPLHDIDHSILKKNSSLRQELIVLIYLMFLLYKKEHLVVDTRPRSPLIQTLDWIMKTENIVLSRSGVTLIDTRWCWYTKDDIVRRGLIIPNFALWRMHNWFNKLLYWEKKEVTYQGQM